MKNFMQFKEDLASGRPMKKPVSSNLLKNMAKDNEKAMASGFMKLSPKERAKESKRLGEETFTPHDMWDENGKKHFAKTEKEHLAMKAKGWGHENPNKSEEKDMCSCDCDCGKAICESCGKPKMQKESARDNYNPEISDKRTKEKLKKAGLPPESPKVMEAKKPIVHSTKKDSLKMIKIKYNSPIKTKVTDIGAGGKEYVRKDWSEETFKPHDMWSPKGEKKFAKTEKEHLALKDKGWGHNNPNKSEEKKKGLDGKECWDGYKQMGTKKKGGKTVDNCVKMKEEQIQLVTNLNQQEGVGAMVRRGLDKVRDSIKTAEVNTGLKVDASKNNIGQNPLKDSQKKR